MSGAHEIFGTGYDRTLVDEPSVAACLYVCVSKYGCSCTYAGMFVCMYTQVHLHPRLHPYPHITHASVCEQCMTYLLLSFDSCPRKRACMCTQTNTHANTHLRQSLSQGRMCAHAPPRTHARTHAQSVETLLSHQLWHKSASAPGSQDDFVTNCSTCQLAKTLQHERAEG